MSSSEITSRTSQQPAGPPAAGRPWRILLADDHAMVREALSQMLERLDDHLQVTQARDLPEALSLLATDSGFSLLLLDYNMPGMEGVASIGTIGAQYPGLPVGVISGYLTGAEVEPLISAGAIGVFPKTMSGPALMMALKLALSGQTYVPWSGDLGQAAPQAARSPADTDLPDLSARQLEVLGHVAAGSPNKEIARALGLSEVTIKIHVAALCRKFAVANRTQLATAALRAGVKPIGDTAG
ncbi:response regulator transcription factor [Dongia mobilis]|uniref:response regulator transcription factor n=1 Tax=Dongia sp. TaxID=1977262 RepID=UPI0026F19583